MNSIWKETAMAVLMGMLLPGILLYWPVEEAKEEAQQLTATEPGEAVEKIPLTMKLRREDGTVETVDMDAYLVGVILAEMPSTFEAEAKKAQAVVARTYARKAAVTGGKHRDRSVCTESACCQAYITPESYLSMGGSEQAVNAAKAAVEATSGQVLTYEGNLIDATYFS